MTVFLGLLWTVIIMGGAFLVTVLCGRIWYTAHHF
jgi:hypothetical protein